jgi:hypothetical protein
MRIIPSKQDKFCFVLLPFLAWLTLRPWRWRWYVPPKRRALYELHGVRTQKTILFTTYCFKILFPRVYFSPISLASGLHIPIKILYAFLIFLMHIICLLDLVTVISIVYSSLTSCYFPLGPDILNTLFSTSLNLSSSLRARDQVPRTYKRRYSYVGL